MPTTKTEKASLKHRLAHELRRLLAIFLYLAVFFLVLRLYTKLVLQEYRLNYVAEGLTLLKALALAKIILTGEALRLGERLRDRPLIVPTVYKTLLFSTFALIFEILEHLILGWVHGKGPGEVVTELLEHGWAHVFAHTLVVFVAFLPFFAFRETERALGEGTVRDLFLKPRATAKVGAARQGGE
jgi:hypothetical protein